MVTTRFERDVGRRAARCVVSGTKRMNFGMWLSGAMMPTFTDNPAILDDDTTHPWIWRRRVQTMLGEAQRPGHELMIGDAEHE